MTYKLHLGDCIEFMRSMPENSFDSIVTDPPYHLTSIVKRFGKKGSAPAQFGKDGVYKRHSTGFMGKEWDGGGIAHDPATWAEVLRVAKPGAHLLAFGGTRTFYRMAVAIEDAGWEIRDTIMWVYSQGFPKSHNLHDEWEGWGTALKPAFEPIVVARKPVEGSVAGNVLKYGTGAMNIDACRVPGESVPINKLENWSGFGQLKRPEYAQEINNEGRWPANLIHDGSDDVVKLFPNNSLGCKPHIVNSSEQANRNSTSKGWGTITQPKNHFTGYDDGDNKSAARFFYCAKASKSDRDEGCEEMEEKDVAYSEYREAMKDTDSFVSKYPDGSPRPMNKQKNNHPTVKPTALMRYLCKLVTPSNGIVFDPFMGSGSTGKAAILEGFNFVGCDTEEDYVKIAKARIEYAVSLKEAEDKEKQLSLL